MTISESPGAAAPPTERGPRRKYVLFGVFGAISLILDLWTKVLARQDLRGHGTKVVIPNYFDLRYAENPGVAFSMLQEIPGGRVLLTLLAVAAFLLVVVYLRKTPNDATRLHVALGLVGGGAIGNLIDRVLYARVTDFVVWKYHQHEWPVFNVADAALCVGVGLMVLDMYLTRHKDRPAAT
jgi:signal peptidase II